MRSRSTRKDKKDSKSSEKRPNLKKAHLNLLLYKNTPLPERLLHRP